MYGDAALPRNDWWIWLQSGISRAATKESINLAIHPPPDGRGLLAGKIK